MFLLRNINDKMRETNVERSITPINERRAAIACGVKEHGLEEILVKQICCGQE